MDIGTPSGPRRGGQGEREGGREEERNPPSPGEAMIKAVMLRWGPLLGGPPCAPNYSSTSPFVFYPRQTFIL